MSSACAALYQMRSPVVLAHFLDFNPKPHLADTSASVVRSVLESDRPAAWLFPRVFPMGTASRIWPSMNCCGDPYKIICNAT